MTQRKKVLAISGSTRKESSNLQIVQAIARLSADNLDMDIFQELDSLPHFNPDLDGDQVPPAVTAFRNRIREAAGVLICTPEYVFSLPGSLKNALEWMVSTTIFSGKPVALITAAAQGEKAHDLTVYHTEVFPAGEGKGIGKKLLEHMVEYARKNNLMVIALCPYVFAQFKRHPELYADIWKNKE